MDGAIEENAHTVENSDLTLMCWEFLIMTNSWDIHDPKTREYSPQLLCIPAEVMVTVSLLKQSGTVWGKSSLTHDLMCNFSLS